MGTALAGVRRHVHGRARCRSPRSALALTGAIPNADAAPPIVNAAILPLLFLSGIFFPLDDNTPDWIVFIGNVFPVKHFVDAMRSAYLSKVVVPTPTGRSIRSSSIGAICW